MKTYQGSEIRNVAVVGHAHCGKTTLIAALEHKVSANRRRVPRPRARGGAHRWGWDVTDDGDGCPPERAMRRRIRVEE